MPEYPFTGPFPRIFSDLCHSDDVHVLRDGEKVDADPGQTVELQPGDVLVTVALIEWAHPELEGAPQPEPEVPADEAEAAEPRAENDPPADPPAATRRRRTADTPAPGDPAPATDGDTPPADPPA